MDITKIYVRYSYYFLFFFMVGIVIVAMISVELLINYSLHISMLFVPGIFYAIFINFIGINFVSYYTLKTIYQDVQNYTGYSIINDIRPFKPFIETEKYILEIGGDTYLHVSFKYHKLSKFIIFYIPLHKKYKLIKKDMDKKLIAEYEKKINEELKQFFHKTHYLGCIRQKKNKNLEMIISGGDWVTNSPAFWTIPISKISGIPLEGALDFINEFDDYLNSNNSLKKL